MPQASQGEVWQAALSPTIGREQAGSRPMLVISVDGMNHGPSGLVIALPITRTPRPGIPTRVPVSPPEGGLDDESSIICEQVRAISTERLLQRRGRVRHETLVKAIKLVRLLTRPPE